MKLYFLTANVWLFLAVLVFVGRTYERDAPLRYSVFNGGQWFSPGAYTLLILSLIAVAGVFFFLAWKTQNTSSRS